MPFISVKKVVSGVKLAEDVYTPLGGLLFTKGTRLTARDLEFLEAFQIAEVNIEDEEKVQAETAAGAEAYEGEGGLSQTYKEFQQYYDKAVNAFRILMNRVQAGNDVPVLAMRELVSPLLAFVREQPNILHALRRVSHVDTYAYEHSVAVGLLSITIAKWMKLPETEWMQIGLAGTLLDIGKLKIDKRILLKPGKLSPTEYEEIKQHTVYGYQMLKGTPGLTEGVALAALQHHEREDGSGYPFGLTGNKLHLYSKIAAVADVYHAMCSDRVYQKALSPYQVAEQLIQDSFGKLDPSIVLTFVNGITQFSAGTVVELSDGSFAKIVFTDRNQPTRPMVEVGGQIINLAEARHLSIIRVI